MLRPTIARAICVNAAWVPEEVARSRRSRSSRPSPADCRVSEMGLLLMSRIMIYMTQRLTCPKRVALDCRVARACSIRSASSSLRYRDFMILSSVSEISLPESCGIAVKLTRVVVQVGYSSDPEEGQCNGYADETLHAWRKLLGTAAGDAGPVLAQGERLHRRCRTPIADRGVSSAGGHWRGSPQLQTMPTARIQQMTAC